MQTVTIPWGEGKAVSGRYLSGDRRPGVVLAHGAGVGQEHPGITTIRDGLAAAGFPVLTFNYPYMEAGRKSPDPANTLLAAHRSAVAWFRRHVTDRVVLAGRSMGGRMASMLAADGEPCDGLILYAYPLHPAGRSDRLRIEHLGRITVPMLFFVGTRDRLALPDLVDAHLRALPTAVVVDIPDADHSFRVPKRTGRTWEEVMDEIVSRSVAWLTEREPTG